MRSSITALVDELRALIGDLRPPALAELGLLPAVELLLDRSGEEGPEVSLVVQGDERRLAPQSELALFRIVQEAGITSAATPMHAAPISPSPMSTMACM